MNEKIQKTINEIIVLVEKLQNLNRQNNFGAKIDQEMWMLESQNLIDSTNKLNVQIKTSRENNS